jgi:pyruvate dehydrogenase E1 component beta subunit
MSYREAVAAALAEELERDEDVFVMGEDVGAAGGVFKATQGLVERFGAARVRDTPISEQAIVGCALGAALTGLRPVAEIMFADFAAVCYDQIANQLAKYRFMTGGQAAVPVTVRLANGAGLGFGAQHSQSSENWFLNVPGLKICVPATPADAYGLIKSAVRDDGPVLVFEHKQLYGIKGQVELGGPPLELGSADVVRSGRHATVVATQAMRHRAVAAAEVLAAEGVDIEIIDLRTLSPLDFAAVRSSLERTNRLACIQEAPASGSWGAGLIAAIAEDALDLFDVPPRLIAAPAVPIGYARSLEEACIPSVDRIVEEVRALAVSR